MPDTQWPTKSRPKTHVKEPSSVESFNNAGHAVDFHSVELNGDGFANLTEATYSAG